MMKCMNRLENPSASRYMRSIEKKMLSEDLVDAYLGDMKGVISRKHVGNDIIHFKT